MPSASARTSSRGYGRADGRLRCRTILRLAIGIPTRNRDDLAAAAVESVLRAEDARIALVVSDNSTDPEASERLRAFCAHRADRVRYVRPPEPLPMPDHWEWLAGHMRETLGPTHIAYLSDRMVFAAGALEQLLGVVERHPDRVVSYRFDRVQDVRTPVELIQTAWTGKLLVLDAERLLELSSRDALFTDHLPRMNNSIAPVGVLDAIAERFGDVLRSIGPDYAFAYRSLAICDSILHLDRACLIQYGLARSNGFSHLRGQPNEASADFARNLTTRRAGATPEPGLATLVNDIFHEYCLAREQAGNGRFPPLDRRVYVAENAVAAGWIADPELRARTEEQLRGLGWTRRARVRRRVEDALRRAVFLARHPSVLRQPAEERLLFDDVATAIAYDEAHPRPRSAHAWHLEALRRVGAIVRAEEPV